MTPERFPFHDEPSRSDAMTAARNRARELTRQHNLIYVFRFDGKDAYLVDEYGGLGSRADPDETDEEE